MLDTLQRFVDRVRGADGSTDRSPARTDGGTVTGEAGPATETRDGTDSRLVSREFLGALPFWLPPFLLMGFFVYGAIGWNFLISLTDMGGFQQANYAALDLEMYRQLWSDPDFWTATQNTLVLLVVFTLVCLVAGLLLAILVDQNVRFGEGFRVIYLLPMSLSFVVTATFWAWIYNPTNGVVALFMKQVGLIAADGAAPKFLSDPNLTMGAIIFALVWQFSGYAMVVYLAGLRAIPTEHFEAARVDGASTLRLYRRVVVPQLRASTVSAAVVLMVFALKAFDFLYVLFGEFPGPAADILATMMYREAFGTKNWAYGSAIAIVLFVLALVVVAPYLYSEYRRGAL